MVTILVGGVLLDLQKPVLYRNGLISIPRSKLANSDPFKSVYIKKKQITEAINNLAACVFQEIDKETITISK